MQAEDIAAFLYTSTKNVAQQFKTAKRPAAFEAQS